MITQAQSILLRTGGPFIVCLLLLTGVVHAQFTYIVSNNTATITGYTGSPTNLIIPGTLSGYPVISIGNNALSYKSTLVSVTIPNSITNIGISAFFGCTNLANVMIPSSLITISGAAFATCRGLTSLTIPNSVTSIGLRAFEYCGFTSLAIPDSVTNIGSVAFFNCQSLTNLVIGSGVTSFDSDAFSTCAALKTIFFKGNAPMPTNNTSVFSGDSAATVYYLPGTSGWGPVFDGLPAVLWNPQAHTGEPSSGVKTNQFGFNITASTNVPIVVETSATLDNSGWIPLFIGTVTNGSIYFSDVNWTNYPTRYYRIRSP